MANFGNLYDYSSSNGVVIPQTSDVKSNVEQAFKDIFGADFSTDETTTNGRLIEAITLLFVDVCGVTAQNINQMNIAQAVGNFLDALGAMFGIARLSGETDAAYRKRIVLSASRGSGFARSMMNAIGKVSGVTGVVVLDNGNEDPDAGHSVFICVRGGNDNDIAAAIRDSKSAGCGYTTDIPGGTLVVQSVVDSETGTSFTAKFFRPSERYVGISASVVNGAYSGEDILSDAEARIRALLGGKPMNTVVTKSEVVAAVASGGSGIIAEDIVFRVSDTDPTLATGEETDRIVVMPYMFISPDGAVINLSES